MTRKTHALTRLMFWMQTWNDCHYDTHTLNYPRDPWKTWLQIKQNKADWGFKWSDVRNFTSKQSQGDVNNNERPSKTCLDGNCSRRKKDRKDNSEIEPTTSKKKQIQQWNPQETSHRTGRYRWYLIRGSSSGSRCFIIWRRAIRTRGLKKEHPISVWDRTSDSGVDARGTCRQVNATKVGMDSAQLAQLLYILQYQLWIDEANM